MELHGETVGIGAAATVVEDQKVVAAGEVDDLLDAVVGGLAMVGARRPVRVEFAILAGPGGGVDVDLLEFDDAAGDGRPVRNARGIRQLV